MSGLVGLLVVGGHIWLRWVRLDFWNDCIEERIWRYIIERVVYPLNPFGNKNNCLGGMME